MATTTLSAAPGTAAAAAVRPYTTGRLASMDGTAIGYRQLGQGPGLVILHGSMSNGYYHLELAEALADRFTVYLPDRRGFGLSGPFSPDDGIQKDVEDLDALLAGTGAHYLFGVSAGAIIALKAALTLPAIHKLAIFEPPLFANGAIPGAMVERYDREMAQGRAAAALTTVMKGAPLISDWFSALPRWLIEFMTARMMAHEVAPGAGEYASFRQLAPTLHHDGRIITELSGRQEALRAIQAEVLLLGGGQSTAFLKAGLHRVAGVLPRANRVVLPGLNHSSPWNTELRGKSGPIAQELLRFFG